MINIFAVISCLEQLSYYISIVLIIYYLYDVKLNFKGILVSACSFVALALINLSLSEHGISNAAAVFQIIEILLIRCSLRKSHIRTIIDAYLVLFSACVMTASTLSGILSLSITTNFEKIMEAVIHFLMLAVCCILCLTPLRRHLQQIVIQTPAAVKRLVIAVMVSCSFATSLIYYSEMLELTPRWRSLTQVILSILILLFAIVVPLLMITAITNQQHKKQTELFEQQISAQLEQYKLLSQSDFEMRRFRHDYKNMYLILSRLIEEGRNSDALKLLENNHLRFESSLIQFQTGNGIVDALLTEKQKQADKIHAKIFFEGAVPSEKIKPTDLCIIFGNTLDNAIEACGSLDPAAEKTIHVSCTCSSGFAFITIDNPVAHKIEINGKLPMTTKSDRTCHGFGLRSLQKTIHDYDGSLECQCDDNEFSISMEFALA